MSYEFLNLIVTLAILFYTLVIDFIVELLKIDNYNILLIIIDKFIKKILLIFKKNI